MKTEIEDSKYGLSITMTPETPEEVAILTRFTLNVNSERPQVNMNFVSKPYCNVYLLKRHKGNKVSNHIRPIV